ncbi:GYD family protein [Streptomyces agglomeratus]|uniref:GYD family protein n=1 Tax=Streptomyces agglomeratus TaxID=285458 RepID=A0A1E5P634_9ACTN|nr:GYD domain-containing protein [Streptomyces agglomeratus]OEJ25020.1 GYD family protein [Streptomyces agglomeratus]OEJ40955.1 GYD family protein [Streptomyces agglomeratus]OEJ44667.1 GYD family protein [Streptomyces agglomeratus]OEJ53490.1 GYD family protein [Streptomyces agglomeratus]OEJ60830.1 GYD family protein [Streptomyces agglomeratus]
MPTYVTLLNWTDQGIRAYRDTPQRAEAFAAAAQKLGAKLLNIYWTVGSYDLVAVVEAPDDETATAMLLQVGGLGNVRTTTLRAFDREEMDRIIAKATG